MSGDAPPAGERPGDRRALQSVSAQFFANGAVYATFVPQLPELREQVGISVGALGVVLMLGSISGLVGSLLTGRVIARFGTRRVMIVGAVLSIGSLPVVGFATSPAMLVVGLVGLLFFDVFIDVAMNVQGSVLSARRHTPVMNRLHGLWSLGGVAGGVVTVLATRSGVSPAAHLTGVAVALVGVLLFVAPGLLRVDEAHAPEEPVAGGGLHGDELLVDDDTVAAIRARRFGPAAALLAAGGGTAMLLEVTNGDWAAFRLSLDFDASPGVASLAFLAFTTAMTIGRLGGDWAQVRIGRLALRRTGVAVAAFGSVLATLVPVEAVSVVGFFVAGSGVSVLFPQLYDQAARSAGPPGSGFAAMLIGQRSMAITAPLLVGTLADATIGGTALDVGDAMAIVLVPASVVAMAITFAPSTVRALGHDRRPEVGTGPDRRVGDGPDAEY
jgi:MFS family permease